MNTPLAPGMEKKVVIEMEIEDTQFVGVSSTPESKTVEFTLELE